MKLLTYLKNKITEQYRKAPAVFNYIGRFALSFAVLLALSLNIGFNVLLTNPFFIIGFAVVCAFVPVRLNVLFIAAYTVVQVFSLSPGLGLLSCVIFIIFYLIYFRFDDTLGYVILLIPLCCMIRLPILIPLVLAAAAPAHSVVCMIMGFILYYFIHYLHGNMAVFQGIADNSEITKMSIAVKELGSSREMWYTILCVLAAFFVVYYLKKIRVNRSNQIAISLGSGIYLILILAVNLLQGTITRTRLIWYLAGTVAACLLALLMIGFLLPLDYSRTEFLEFEDDEYKYYVRAVPKAYISREMVKIQRIYSRKRMDQPKGRGDRS